MNATHEEWRPVVGYEGLYEVSDLGRVKSLRRSGRILSPSKTPFGHPNLALGRGNRAYVHHLVLEAFVGERPLGKEACHTNGDPADNRATNLYWGSRSDNVRDSIRHGTHNHAHKAHCKNGHEFTEENTYISPYSGQRVCRQCRRIASRESQRRRRAKERFNLS